MTTTSLPVAVDPVALVTSECITVTSAMRKHARWAHSSVSAILGGSSVSKVYDRDVSAPRGIPDGPLGLKLQVPTTNEDHLLANRWGLRGKKGKSMQDNPLISAFTRLRCDLKSCKDIMSFDTPALLHPFLQVIRSSSTSAAITSLALIAITKFFSYNIINRDSPRLLLALQLLSAAITHCRFEASDSAADEVVLLRILKLMESIISRPEGQLLGDESVCELMETGLSMCCQNRLSDVLRMSAEMAMINMCQVIFTRLSCLDYVVPMNPGQLSSQTEADPSRFRMDLSVNGDTVASQHQSAIGSDTVLHEPMRASDEALSGQTINGGAIVAPPSPRSDTGDEIMPYSLPSIRELFRVLIDLLDPHNRQHTDSMRIIALRIIDVALETAGPSIAMQPSLAALAEDDLCRHLFQLVRSENIAILTGSLRVIDTLLRTCRSVLKLQQELYLSYLVACLHPRIEIPREPGIDPSLYEGVPQAPKLVKPSLSQGDSGRSTPIQVKDRQRLGLEGGNRKPETHEAMVESVGALARIPSFMVELFVNYDCEADRADLCEDMVGLLARNAFPDSATWSTTSVPPLCLDALLSYIQFVYDRLDDEPNRGGFPEYEQLRDQRKVKKLIIKGAQKFNEDPKAGIAYLAVHGIIKDPNDPAQVAKFLKESSRLSKKTLGDYISKRSNQDLLEAFVDMFDFSSKTVVEALREFLGAFRLPGEAPLIERIVTTFSEKFMTKARPEGVADKDSLFVLTYGIILLNTDMYNPNVKSQNRMSYTDFAKNLRGVNAGMDFAPEFLQEIYDSIKQNEIILPDEHENKHAFDYAWRELLLKASSAGKLVTGETNIYDAEMFSVVWPPVIATLSYVLMSASDDAVLSRIVTGFNQCAQIAAKYRLTEAFDRIVFSLASISTLATNDPPSTSLNTEVQAGKRSVMVSELAVKLGRDLRAQLAVVVLFRVLAGNENLVRGSWVYIVRILRNLFINSLAPPFDIPLRSVLDISPIPLQPPSQVVDRDGRGNEAGLFSAFTSYLSSYAADDPPEPSDEELENTLCTVDCVTACSISEVMGNIGSLPTSSIVLLVECLLAQLPEETTPAVIVVKPERPQNILKPVNGNSDPSRPTYDPAVMYTLELATILTLRDQETLVILGEGLSISLQSFIRNARNIHPLALSRIVYYLLEQLRLSHDQPFVRVPVILHSISGLDQDILESVALAALKGLSRCIRDTTLLRNEITMSPDFWSILQRLHRHEEAGVRVFELLETIAESAPYIINADNYEAVISLANDFVNAGSIGSLDERQRDAITTRASRIKQPKPSENQAVARGIKALAIIYQLAERVPMFIKQSHLEEREAWSAYWSPIFQSLAQQCVNPCRDIRRRAISTLQRCLLSVELISSDERAWVAIFDQVLFPLILRLLKPETYHSDPTGMGETRVQAATLLCKMFLRYLDQFPNEEAMLALWLKILDILDRMMNSGQGDNLEEAVPESLKNILLLMANGGYLVPPSQGQNEKEIWTESRKRIDRFLPDLFLEIFPNISEPPAAASSPRSNNDLSADNCNEQSNSKDDKIAA